MEIFNLEPVGWSRNWDDEEFEDDIEAAETPIVFKSVNNREQTKEVDLLIVGVSGLANVFLDACFPSKVSLGSIEHKQARSPERTECTVYKIEGAAFSTILITCGYEVESERSNEWVRCVFQQFQPKSALILDKLLLCNYFGGSNPSFSPTTALVRKIETTARKNRKGESICPFLEAPNVIDRISAALLTRCELKNIAATLYVVVEDNRLKEDELVMSFQPILTSVGLFPKDFDRKKVLQKLSGRKVNPLFL
eukprot:TRINITY_DN2242_c0_g1_i2.p1 TRINITY_DN2242_c0_g1~~TRINITY_DN2242_c0_g1_i2.p1  ORF type:complete len:264 (+),score=39.62 TRINITY_DN2242_c0_g1_i2:37-792(+)